MNLLEPTTNLEAAYRRSLKFSLLVFVDILIFALIVEGLRLWRTPFYGFAEFSTVTVRYIFYGLGLVLVFLFKGAANYPLKHKEAVDLPVALKQLQMSALIVYGLCEVVALFGLILFLLAGAHKGVTVVDFKRSASATFAYLEDKGVECSEKLTSRTMEALEEAATRFEESRLVAVHHDAVEPFFVIRFNTIPEHKALKRFRQIGFVQKCHDLVGPRMRD